MAVISPQTDASDPLFTCIDEHALTDPQVPDVLSERLAGKGHAQAVVGQQVAGAGDRVVRRDGSLHVISLTVGTAS
jgi:hypothetical protein